MATTEAAIRTPAARRGAVSPPPPTGGSINVGSLERTVSALGGAALALYGLRRRDAGGLLAGLLGAAALKRGVTGHCEVFGALGVSSAEDDADASTGLVSGTRRTVALDASATVRKPADELYRLWHDPTNLPRFMTFLDGVEVVSETRARWRLSAPLGQTIEWVAEVTDDEPGRRIGWRAVEGAMIEHSGEVRFEAAPADRGTEVRLSLRFRPPGGAAGAALASLFDGTAEMKLRGDLKRFKQLVETGEIATTEGQPSGRR
jgi:uncharacterized membrane protein